MAPKNTQLGKLYGVPNTGVSSIAPLPGMLVGTNLPSAPPVPQFSGGPTYVRPPSLDIAATQAKARAEAEGAVNPFYTKQLNDFLAQQAAQRQRQQTAYDTAVKYL